MELDDLYKYMLFTRAAQYSIYTFLYLPLYKFIITFLIMVLILVLTTTSTGYYVLLFLICTFWSISCDTLRVQNLISEKINGGDQRAHMISSLNKQLNEIQPCC
jgi:hypothetical protein